MFCYSANKILARVSGGNLKSSI